MTTQDPLRQKALVVTDKAPRVAQFHANTLHALKELLQAAGLNHPDDVTSHHIVRRIDDTEVRLLSSLMPRLERGAILNDLAHQPNVFRLYWPLASSHTFAPQHPAAGDTPPDLRDSRGVHKTRTPSSAREVAQELNSSHPPEPPAESPVSPEQAHSPAATPASPTDVPTEWGPSDTGTRATAAETLDRP